MNNNRLLKMLALLVFVVAIVLLLAVDSFKVEDALVALFGGLSLYTLSELV